MRKFFIVIAVAASATAGWLYGEPTSTYEMFYDESYDYVYGEVEV